MKPTASPRLICRIVRQWSALAGNEDGAHVASCVDCQEFFRASHDLDAALRRDAAPSTVAPSDDFEQQILRAVHNSQSQSAISAPRPARSLPQWGGLWALGGAVAAIAVALVAINRQSLAPPPSVAADAPTPADAAAIVEAVNSVSNRLVDSVLPSTMEFVADNPLQQELSSIRADAQSALNFLALNFLPRSSLAAAEPVPRRSI